MDLSLSPAPELYGGNMRNANMRNAGMRLAVLLVVFVLSIFLVQIIWNNVIVEKFPNARIQKLTFWDSLAIAVFVSLLTGGSATMITIKG
jgi:hypothetical protein